MASRPKFFSWSKGRHVMAEPYHRTGGLLPIDTNVGLDGKQLVQASAKHLSSSRPNRPPNLTIITPEYNSSTLNCSSPASVRHNAALVSSASNLLAVVNGMLRSPTSNTTLRPESASLHKPLPSRPRSVSLPSSPDLPVELPGSILLDNQGFTSPPPIAESFVFPASMSTARSGSSVSPFSEANLSRRPHHQKSSSETNLQRCSVSRPHLVTSPSSADSKLTLGSISTARSGAAALDSPQAYLDTEKSQPSPLITNPSTWRNGDREGMSNSRRASNEPRTSTSSATRERKVDELKAVVTAQDQTISTLQAQFASLRTSHEVHVTTLVDAHSAEIASLRHYTKALEEQQIQRPHHASNDNLLFYLERSEQQSSSVESPQTTTSGGSSNSVRSFGNTHEQQNRSSLRPYNDSPEMEDFKRRLSTTRRPDVGSGDMIRELNMYKQNNVALQKQVEILMGKLNQSKTQEREQQRKLNETRKTCNEYREEARSVGQLQKSTTALQNTIDHLEYRLEVANADKVDAEEQLLMLRLARSAFDLSKPPADPFANQQTATIPADSRYNTRTGNDTIPIKKESQEPRTLAAFIQHIEKLQEEVGVKDDRYAKLELQHDRLQQSFRELEISHRELTLQSQIQGQLLGQMQQNESHLEDLQTTILQRETVIAEKNKAMDLVKRQLSLHRTLLAAEIKRHATSAPLGKEQHDPLPDLDALASKEDIDRWTNRLQKRLEVERTKEREEPSAHDTTTTVRDLRQEIDFYVREIIYYKLDIRGYKSDIRRLKRTAGQRDANSGNIVDTVSPDPSLGYSDGTPIKARFSAGPEISAAPSPDLCGPTPSRSPAKRLITPPPSDMTPDMSPSYDTLLLDATIALQAPLMTPRTPTRRTDVTAATVPESVNPGGSPKSPDNLPEERQKLTMSDTKNTPVSVDTGSAQIHKFGQAESGHLSTNISNGNPATPTRNDTQRSISESILRFYTQPRTPERSPHPAEQRPIDVDGLGSRPRSASVPDVGKQRNTPERPPRPRHGLFESPSKKSQEVSLGWRTPPRMDVMAEAMRSSPNRAQPLQRNLHANMSATNTSLHHRSRSDSRAIASARPSVFPAPLAIRSHEAKVASNVPQAQVSLSQSSRRLSTGSSDKVPFVIAMGSPHNPPLTSPTAAIPPRSSSIAGTTSLITGPEIRAGVGDTTASSTPFTSPVSPKDVSTSYASKTSQSSSTEKPLPLPPPESLSCSAASTYSSGGYKSTSIPTSAYSLSIPARLEKHTAPSTSATPATVSSSMDNGLRTSAHSRHASSASILQAMNVPTKIDFLRAKGKSRNESIIHSTPLDTPFNIERTTAGFGIGEAI